MNKTDQLLQMLEQPQRYTAEEWQEILADDECRELYTLMSKTQSVVSAARADEEVTDEMIDAEWQRLRSERREVKSERYPFLKIAAMFVGVLMLSGIAYAAIHIVRHEGDLQPSAQETRILDSRQPALPADTADTIPMAPQLYDNVPLGEILEKLAAYYHIRVEYHNEATREVRLFYQWKPEYSLGKVVEMLNNFEWLQLELENDTLFVSSNTEPQP